MKKILALALVTTVLVGCSLFPAQETPVVENTDAEVTAETGNSFVNILDEIEFNEHCNGDVIEEEYEELCDEKRRFDDALNSTEDPSKGEGTDEVTIDFQEEYSAAKEIESSKDVAKCKELTDKNLKLQCEVNIYLALAEENQDSSYCNKIEDSVMSELCNQSLAD